jgi:gliding motility-associated-like protein
LYDPDANMPAFSFKFILPVLMMLLALQANGQTCTGSLGDPVINETFGAGTTYGTGPALPAGVTTYNYIGQSCPGDEGSYTIATASGTCFGGTWQVVSGDHTGDPNGYMMIINASSDPGLFYTQKASGNLLCPNTTYEFAAWIRNIMRDLPNTQGYHEPNITFSIETVSGVVLKTYNTGTIPQEDLSEFKQYGTFFTTPSNGEDLVVKMINNAPGGLGNDLVLDDITFRPCGPVILAGFGTVGEVAERDLCEGESRTYTLTASQTGYNNPYYQWQVKAPGRTDWQDLPGENTVNLNRVFTNAVAGKYQYRIGILDGPGASLACRIYSQPLVINVNAHPVVVINKQTIVCDNVGLQLTATGGTTYHWTGPNNFVSEEQSPVVSYTPNNTMDGVYTVIVTKLGCSTVASTAVSVLPKVVPGISNNVTVCAGDATRLQASGGITYKWTPAAGLDHDDIASPIATPLITTTYHVSIDNGGCVDETQQVTVTVLKRPVANAGRDISIQEGETVNLTGTAEGDNVIYYWTPANHIEFASTLTPAVSLVNDVTYTLHVESQDNCGTATDDVFVRVYKKITIPTAFSPNNDGVNDLWNIDQLYTYPDAIVNIYTRTGAEIYRSVGYSKPWTGNYNGSLLPAGVYYYIIDLKNKTTKRSGWVYLVR